MIDATFWVMISFFAFIGLLIYFKIPQKIKNTLDSLSFADEIVIILDRSTDQTRQKSNDYTKKIYEGSWISEVKRRNYGISKCSSEWILEVDADEVINKNLRFENMIVKTGHLRLCKVILQQFLLYYCS